MNIDINSYNSSHFDLFHGILISQDLKKIDSIIFQCQNIFSIISYLISLLILAKTKSHRLMLVYH